LAQTKEKSPASAHPNTAVTSTTTRSTAAGEVASSGAAVTSPMIAEQNDPKLIGSPAWWRTHATADGKPLSAEKPRQE
jgi:hypothetical protein